MISFIDKNLIYGIISELKLLLYSSDVTNNIMNEFWSKFGQKISIFLISTTKSLGVLILMMFKLLFNGFDVFFQILLFNILLFSIK